MDITFVSLALLVIMGVAWGLVAVSKSKKL